jgi:hypothetical protein
MNFDLRGEFVFRRRIMRPHSANHGACEASSVALEEALSRQLRWTISGAFFETAGGHKFTLGDASSAKLALRFK